VLRTPSVILISGAVFFVGCGDGGVSPTPTVLDCSAVTPTVLAVGQSAVLNAQDTACVRLPAAGPDGAEYLYVAVATAARESKQGVLAPYDLSASLPESTATAAAVGESPLLQAFRPPSTAQQFHQRLRAMEREISQDPRMLLFNGLSAAVVAQHGSADVVAPEHLEGALLAGRRRWLSDDGR